MSSNFYHNDKYPLLTCIVVTYRQREYLIENLQSILFQDYPNIEIIVSDDGTMDFDVAAIEAVIVDGNRGNIKRVTIIHHNENVGTVKNINSALRKANGEYIKLIGGDDSYPSSDVFTRQADVLLSDSSALLVIGRSQQCDYRLNPIRDRRVSEGNKALDSIFRLSYSDARKFILKKDIFPIVTQAVCFTKKYFDCFGLYDEQYAVLDDSLTALKILRCAKNVRVLDIICVNHRSNVGISTSKEFFSPRRLKYYKDCAIYAENEIAPYAEIFGPIYRFEIPRISWLQYYMSLSKYNKESRYKRAMLLLKYADAIIYYIISRPKKFLKRFWYRLCKIT